MRLATLGCWWSGRAFPKEQPCWSGIRNELEGLALDAERNRGLDVEATEYARLAALANAQIAY